jgi:oligopeptide transport system ATP-binding protein
MVAKAENPVKVAKAESPLVEINNLKMYFPVTRGIIFQKKIADVKAVNDVSFNIQKGETLGLVGESGSGKTTAGRSILHLIKPTAGSVKFDGEEVTEMTSSRLREMRRKMQIIFQDPYGSLNPRMTCGDIVGEPLKIHKLTSSKKEYKNRVAELLEICGLSGYMSSRYPHEFSGGQRQRIGIARALAVDPSFIVCDEPVSALDVSIQAQVINLLEDLQKELDLTYLFIAHDLSVVKHISNRIAVMYLGNIVEIAERNELYENPTHPYTKALLSAIPIPDPALELSRDRIVLRGQVPSPMNPPSACSYDPLCPTPNPACDDNSIIMREVSPGHSVAHCAHCADDYGCYWFPRVG